MSLQRSSYKTLFDITRDTFLPLSCFQSHKWKNRLENKDRRNLKELNNKMSFIPLKACLPLGAFNSSWMYFSIVHKIHIKSLSLGVKLKMPTFSWNTVDTLRIFSSQSLGSLVLKVEFNMTFILLKDSLTNVKNKICLSTKQVMF